MRSLLLFIIALGLGAGVMYIAYPKPAPLDICQGLACARQKDDWLSWRYEPATPFFLTSANVGGTLNPITPDTQKDNVLLVLDQLAQPSLSRMAASPKPTGCAVVGALAGLKASALGSAIDGHSWVWRINNELPAGSEGDAGARTTYHVVDMQAEHIAAFGPDTTTILSPVSFQRSKRGRLAQPERPYLFHDTVRILAARVVPDIVDASKRELRQIPLADNIAESADAGLLIMHPQFVAYLNSNWYEGVYEPNPSTGFRAVVLALHACDSVDLYGFGLDTPAGAGDTYETRFLRRLVERRIVASYR